jgi:hypothetical protein
MDEPPMNNWKQFQGTELGGLLGSIYGNQNRTKINYPVPKQKQCIEKKEFIPGGGKIDSTDPRKSTRRAVSLNVPKPTGRGGKENDEFSSLKPVDFIPKRKSADSIKVEMDDIRLKQERYRPAHVKPISSEAEKERLSQICTFKGGKGLPQELTHLTGEMPLEAAQRAKERERIEAIRQKRGLLAVQQKPEPVLSVNEQLAQQISREIEELTEHFEEMKTLGLSKEKEGQLRHEISIKIQELNKVQNDS